MEWIESLLTDDTEVHFQLSPRLLEAFFSAPDKGGQEDVLDWDFTIDAPPPRSSGKLKVKLAFAGRDEPLPVEDPWA